MVPVGSCVLARIRRSVVARAGPGPALAWAQSLWPPLRRAPDVWVISCGGGRVRTVILAGVPAPAGMSSKPNLTAHTPAAALNAISVHSPSTSKATSSQYRQLLCDYGPLSLGYTQGTGNSQVLQSKYAELLAIVEELGKEIRPSMQGARASWRG